MSTCILIIFCSILYIIFMNPAIFRNNEEIFVRQACAMFSFYEYQFYTLVLLPIYLVFSVSANVPFIQKIVRERNRKTIALLSIRNNLLTSFIFTLVVYSVGVFFPIMCGVMNDDFFIIYSIQSVLMFLLFAIVGNFMLIIDTFTSNTLFKIGIPILIVMIYHAFRMMIFNIFQEISLIVIYYLGQYENLNIGVLFVITLVLLLGSGLIKLYISSEEEYFNAK